MTERETLQRLALLCWLGVGTFLGWAITFFLGELHGGPRRAVCLAGIALASVVLGVWALHSCRYLLALRERSTRRARPSRDVEPTPLHEQDDVSPREGLGAAWAAAGASLARWAVGKLDGAREATAVPEVLLVRAGQKGVELLLREPVEVAPFGFELLDKGWSLRPLAVPVGPEADRETWDRGDGVTELVELGSDEDGTYFVPGSTAVVAADQLGNAGDDAAAPLVVVREPHEVVVEPFGLRLSPPGTLEGRDDPAAPDEPGAPPAGPEPGTDGEEVQGGLVEEALEASKGEDGLRDEMGGDAAGKHLACEGSDRRPADPVTPPVAPPSSAACPTSEPLVPPGPVEVRLLRDEPDLVGELLDDPAAAAVELVAYLATHGHRATTSKLRDALGTARSRSSRSGRTVWNAASFARRCLGEDRVPQASGNQLYVLSSEVTSDWGRFVGLADMAKRASDPLLARRALAEALGLVDGVPAAASLRYCWLDTERLLDEITGAVLAAACRLAELELERLADGEGSREDAAFAIRKGHLVSPRAPELEALEERLDSL